MPLLVHSTVCIIQELLASSSFHVVIPQRPSTWLMIDGLRLLIATPVGLLWCLIILWIGNTVQLRLLWKYGGTWSLKKRAEIEEDEPLILVYQDEVHFQIQTTVTSGWYKKGSAPTVKSFPGRFKTSYSGFVIPESGQLFAAKLEMFNYETTIDSIRLFLSEHPAPEGKKYALVMDNSPWHKKTMRLVETQMLP